MEIHNNPNAHLVNILLIEDEDADARLMSEAMTAGKLQNKLIRVHSGQEALDYLYQRGQFFDVERPDLIILDLNMPHMDGRELLVNIQGNDEITSIPLVVLSNSADEQDIIDSYANKANCFITKPLDFDKFVEVVQSIEHFWFTIAKRPN